MRRMREKRVVEEEERKRLISNLGRWGANTMLSVEVAGVTLVLGIMGYFLVQLIDFDELRTKSGENMRKSMDRVQAQRATTPSSPPSSPTTTSEGSNASTPQSGRPSTA